MSTDLFWLTILFGRLNIDYTRIFDLEIFKEVKDVLVSGGDPLTLPDERLLEILQTLSASGKTETLRKQLQELAKTERRDKVKAEHTQMDKARKERRDKAGKEYRKNKKGSPARNSPAPHMEKVMQTENRDRHGMDRNRQKTMPRKALHRAESLPLRAEAEIQR